MKGYFIGEQFNGVQKFNGGHKIHREKRDRIIFYGN
jgi:hypothetical protein